MHITSKLHPFLEEGGGGGRGEEGYCYYCMFLVSATISLLSAFHPCPLPPSFSLSLSPPPPPSLRLSFSLSPSLVHIKVTGVRSHHNYYVMFNHPSSLWSMNCIDIQAILTLRYAHTSYTNSQDTHFRADPLVICIL